MNVWSREKLECVSPIPKHKAQSLLGGGGGDAGVNDYLLEMFSE